MTDREHLEQLFAFLKARKFILADEASVRDMVSRYTNPPLTLYHRAAMQMTVSDYQELGKLLKAIEAHLTEAEHDAEPT